MSTTTLIQTSNLNGENNEANTGPNASDTSLRPWHDRTYRENLAGQHLWATEMQAVNRPIAQDGAALLLSWEVDQDLSMNTTKELADLEDVFTSKYNFTVHKKLLSTHRSQAPRNQMNFILNEFLTEHDKPGADLIVYYGGHGMPSEDGEELRLSGGNDEANDDRESTELVWNDVEPILYKIRANLILIFDCCHAGLVARAKREWPACKSHFEFIASTTHDRPARGPKSRGSFTRAMIGALDQLATKGGFTSRELVRKILKSKVFRGTSQGPFTDACGKKNNYREYKITPKDQPAEATVALRSQEEDTVNFYLHLKYVFKEKPSPAHYKALAERLDDLVKNDRLPIKDVLWEGLSPYNPRMKAEDAARMLFARLGHPCRRRSAGRLEISASTDEPAMPQRTLTMLTTDDRPLNSRPDNAQTSTTTVENVQQERRFYPLATFPIFFRPTPFYTFNRMNVCITSFLILSVAITLSRFSHSIWSWPVRWDM